MGLFKDYMEKFNDAVPLFEVEEKDALLACKNAMKTGIKVDWELLIIKSNAPDDVAY